MLLRLLVTLPLGAVMLAATGLYLSYGEVDPCRVLAVEKARRTEHVLGFAIEGPLETWTRLETSQMSTGACSSELLDSWGQRLDRSFARKPG